MALAESDLVFLHAVDDTDFSTGGGPPTSRIVEDGAINEVFGPLTEADRVTGRNILRRVHAAINTTSTDIALRGHVIIDEPPSGDGIEIVMSSTGDSFDRRPQIAEHFEGYYTESGRIPCFVYLTQPQGSTQIKLWHRVGATPVSINQTFFIAQDYGSSSQVVQAVRCVDILAVETVEQEDTQGTFTRGLTTVKISNTLQSDFIGTDIQRYNPANPRAFLMDSAVTDSTSYFGVKPLLQAVSASDTVIHVEVESQLVPASQRSTNHVGVDPNARRKVLFSAGGQVSLAIATQFGAGATLFMGRPFERASLTLTLDTTVLTTNIDDQLLLGGNPVGFVDPEAGSVTGSTGCPEMSGIKTASFTPVGGYEGPLLSVGVEVTAENQETSWNIVLPFIPASGSIIVAYASNGAWTELLDRGDGYCAGTSGNQGAAVFSAPARTVAISLANNVPDVGNWIIVYFGVAGYQINRGGTALEKAFFELTTTAPIVPGATTINWNDGQAKSASIGANGAITGDATGEVTGLKSLRIRPNLLPPVGTSFSVNITPRTEATESWTSLTLDGSGNVDLQLAHTNIVAGSIRVMFTSVQDMEVTEIYTGSLIANSPYLTALSNPPKSHPESASYHFRDNGAGALSGLSSTLNYSTGALQFHAYWDQAVKVPQYTLQRVG